MSQEEQSLSWDKFNKYSRNTLFQYVNAILSEIKAKNSEIKFVEDELSKEIRSNEDLKNQFKEKQSQYLNEIQYLRDLLSRLQYQLGEKQEFIGFLHQDKQYLQNILNQKPILARFIEDLFMKHVEPQSIRKNEEIDYVIYSQQEVRNAEIIFEESLQKIQRKQKNQIEENNKLVSDLKKQCQEELNKVWQREKENKQIKSTINLLEDKISNLTKYLSEMKKVAEEENNTVMKLSQKLQDMKNQKQRAEREIREFADLVVSYSQDLKQMNAKLQEQKIIGIQLKEQNNYLRIQCITILQQISCSKSEYTKEPYENFDRQKKVSKKVAKSKTQKSNDSLITQTTIPIV